MQESTTSTGTQAKYNSGV